MTELAALGATCTDPPPMELAAAAFVAAAALCVAVMGLALLLGVVAMIFELREKAKGRTP